MKRILYIAILSMMAMTIWTPAALTQQGGGLCPGAVPVTSLSGSAADGEVESEPFDISTDLFQVAVDNTSGAPEGEEGFTFVEVARPGFTGFESMNFGDGEDGIFNASNTGDGPFVVRASSDLQAYDITVYECPQGPPPGDDGGTDDGTTDETGDDAGNGNNNGDTGGSGGTTPDNDDSQQSGDDQYPPEDDNNGSTPGGDQYPLEGDDAPDNTGTATSNSGSGTDGTGAGAGEEGAGTGNIGTGAGAGGEEGTGTVEGGDPTEGSDPARGGATEGDAPDESGVVPILPDTGGASLLALGAGALLVAGGLVARRILR